MTLAQMSTATGVGVLGGRDPVEDEGPIRTVTKIGEFNRWLELGPSRIDLLDQPEYGERLRRYLDGLMAPSVRLISVDVFDTVLIREPTSELRRFAGIAELQAERLQPRFGNQFSGLDLLVARLQATHASYRVSERVSGSREGSITQIYRTVETQLGLQAGLHEQLIEMELEYESSVLHPNRALIAWLDKQRDRGVDVMLLSDMYLHGTHIKQLLRTADVLADIDVVSSADNKLTKHGGTAFANLLAERAVSAAEAIHLGDSLRSDYKMARRAGLRSAYLPIPLAERKAIRSDHDEMLARLLDDGVNLDRWITCGH